jgi:poly(3-hydroxybutyrate) depolymerase
MTALLTWVGIVVASIGPAGETGWWDPQVEASLDRAPARKARWVERLESCPTEQRAGLAYLLTYLPKRDLETMAPEAMAANVALAYRARGEVPWGASLPDEVFLDAVLPHVSVTEPREPMRAEFHDRYLPLVRTCKRPGEAAHELNKALFRDYKVAYNTRRLRTDQCSKESIQQGMATCTGLSIMLVEACRSVGVPARLAGIAAWPGRGGNHTWVEVWDGGWHFVGAAEPDGNGLDHAWFVGDAAKAVKGSGQNAIYAVTYRPTGSFFPMVWAESDRVPGEDVTDRYTRGALAAAPPPTSRLMVEVRRKGQRVEAEVMTLDRATGARRAMGTSLGPSADINRHLTCAAAPGGSLLVVARDAGGAAVRPVAIAGDTVVRVDLEDPASKETRAELSEILADRFSADESRRAAAKKMLAELPWDESMRALGWTAYKASPIHEPLRREFEARTVSTKDRTSPYLWRHVGEKPENGWALVIAMHGGGGTEKEVNDEQWKSMFEEYYREHPEAGGYVYLALRAPNDEWNGFYDDAICPLVERLIRQFVLFDDVDPDRVYALGASHGGYGAFVIGPKMPDRFAAVHASAAAPTDGETMSENLRDLRFTVMVGEEDTAYGRADRCRAFVKAIDGLKARYGGGYPGEVRILAGVGHSVPDGDMVGRMLKEGVRSPWPNRVVWAMSDDVLKHFYWLEATKPESGGRIEAVEHENTIALKAEKQDEVILWLDSALVDLARPVVVERDGKRAKFTPRPSPETFCEGLERRGDPRLAAPARITSGSGR